MLVVVDYGFDGVLYPKYYRYSLLYKFMEFMFLLISKEDIEIIY